MKFLITLYLTLMFISAFAQDNCLDSEFGINGKVVTTIGTNRNDVAMAMVIQPDQKIVLAGFSDSLGDADILLIRYHTDGSIDNSFGNNGSTITKLGSKNDIANAVILQTDGKILIAGSHNNGNNNDFMLARYLENGKLDDGFGTSGIVKTNLGNSNELLRSIGLQSDGKIVVAGKYSTPTALSYFTVARYNVDGSLDVTFSGDGTSIDGFYAASENDESYSLLIQPDGKILLVGKAKNETPEFDDFGLIRYNTDGSLDSTFGTNGKVTANFGNENGVGYPDDFGYAAALQYDNKIVVVGGNPHLSNSSFKIARFLPNGALDITFGDGGKVVTKISQDRDEAFAVAIQADQRILVGGYSGQGLAVVRYLENGIMDSTFCYNGIANNYVIGIGQNIASSNRIFTLKLQDDGKIVAAGRTSGNNNSNSYFDIAMVRYHQDILENSKEIVTSPTFSLYPNPLINKGVIEFTKPISSVMSLRIVDITGRSIKNITNYELIENGRQQIEFHIDELKSGYYILEVQTKNGFYHKILIK